MSVEVEDGLMVAGNHVPEALQRMPWLLSIKSEPHYPFSAGEHRLIREFLSNENLKPVYDFLAGFEPSQQAWMDLVVLGFASAGEWTSVRKAFALDELGAKANFYSEIASNITNLLTVLDSNPLSEEDAVREYLDRTDLALLLSELRSKTTPLEWVQREFAYRSGSGDSSWVDEEGVFRDVHSECEKF